MALLSESITSGSEGWREHGLRVSPGEPGLGELLSNNIFAKMELMGRMDHDHYVVTPTGKQMMKHCTRLHSPVKLLAYQRPGLGTVIKQEDFTTAELIATLTDLGWSDKEQRKSTKIGSYSLGQPKVWFHHDNRKISKLYLRSLASSTELLEGGSIQEIFHFQSQAYYSAILQGVSVLPGQPLAYYKLCMKRQGMDYDVEGDEVDDLNQGQVQPCVTFDDVSTWADDGGYLYFLDLNLKVQNSWHVSNT